MLTILNRFKFNVTGTRISGSGIIYDASFEEPYGEIVVLVARQSPWVLFANRVGAACESEALVGVIQGMGIGLIITSVAGFVFGSYPIAVPEFQYRARQALRVFASVTRDEELERIQEQMKRDTEEREYASLFAQEVGISDTSFSVYIPKIEARSSVVPSVDPANPSSYSEALKTGIAHAWGTSLPGQEGGTYLFAHSTNAPWNVARYNAVFYLLKELEPAADDEVFVFFQGKLYKYRVAEKHIAASDDISWLTEAISGPERLILQTCWPPGTAWNRLVIVAYPDRGDRPEEFSGYSGVVYGGI